MLIDAVALLAAQRPDARVLVVGGEPAQVDQAKARAGSRRGGGDDVYGTAARERDPRLCAGGGSVGLAAGSRHEYAAENLFVPAIGKPIVATNLLTHTQVLTPEIARLVDPKPGPFAAAMLELMDRQGERLLVGGGEQLWRNRSSGVSLIFGARRWPTNGLG